MQNHEQKIDKLEKELAAKNREVEIEKAFEKVRECAMTMRHSSDLQEVVNLVAQELNNMNLDITGVFMVINNDEIDKQFTFWGSTGVAEIYMKRAAIPFLDRPIYRVLAEGTTKGESFFVEEYTREEKIEFFEHLNILHIIHQLLNGRKRFCPVKAAIPGLFLFLNTHLYLWLIILAENYPMKIMKS